MKEVLRECAPITGIIFASMLGLLAFFYTGQDGMGADAHTHLPLEVTDVTEHGVYFLEATAEYEPIIFKSHGELDYVSYEVGEQVTGEFDADGWELYSVSK